MTKTPYVSEQVNQCNRCGKTHAKVDIFKLTKMAVFGKYAEDFYTHFFMCPTLDEPVFLRVTIKSENGV